MEHESDGRIGVPSALMWAAKVRTELNKMPIDLSINRDVIIIWLNL